jgi:hypothetical protein
MRTREIDKRNSRNLDERISFDIFSRGEGRRLYKASLVGNIQDSSARPADRKSMKMETFECGFG